MSCMRHTQHKHYSAIDLQTTASVKSASNATCHVQGQQSSFGMAEAGAGGAPMPSLGEGQGQQAKDQAKQSDANPYRQAMFAQLSSYQTAQQKPTWQAQTCAIPLHPFLADMHCPYCY